MLKDYYSILDIKQSATREEIKVARNRQAKKWHPDLNPEIDVTQKMQEVNEAYLILADSEARKRYDIEYNNFRKHITEKNAKKKNSQKQDNQKNTETPNYKVKDDLLKKWMTNAQKQAEQIVKNTIRDTKGVAKAAGNGLVNGIYLAIIWGICGSIILLFYDGCFN